MKLLLINILITILFFTNITAQIELPGVNEELRLEIQQKLDVLTQNSFQLGAVLNIDSSLGDCLDPLLYPNYGTFEDPYNMLEDCIVFTAENRNFEISEFSDCLIGIYKNQYIIWTTPLTNGIQGHQTPGIIWSIKDINNNGKVEIITSWIQGFSGIQNYRYLILTWDGTDGAIINSNNSIGYSAIVSKISSNLSYVDVEGDGIWELQISEYIEDQDQVFITTFSWNGMEYGLWQDTPQPQELAIVPRDIINASISAWCRDGSYYYKINSLHGRFQNINTFAIDQVIESVSFVSTRIGWLTMNSFSLFVWINPHRRACNSIHPGEIASDFAIEAVESLPVIVNSYLAGWNGSVSRTNTGLTTLSTNSAQGRTIAPKTIPNPFDPLAFIDNMIDMGDEADALGWIGSKGVETYHWPSLKSKLQSLYGYIVNAQYTLAGDYIVQFLIEVESFTHGKKPSLTTEGYALMYINGIYLKEYIKGLL